MEDLKHRVEAILFSAGKAIEEEELKTLTGSDTNGLRKALTELKTQYNESGSLIVLQEGSLWKMAVRDKYLPLVRNITFETELPKSVMETLAMIAFKAPVIQSDIVKVRSNKAYEHISELEKLGYVAKVRKGRSYVLKLAPHFFEYFDIEPGKMEEIFKDLKDLARAIQEKEKQVEKIRRNSMENKEKEQHVEKKNREVIGKEMKQLEAAHEAMEQDGVELSQLEEIKDEEIPMVKERKKKVVKKEVKKEKAEEKTEEPNVGEEKKEEHNPEEKKSEEQKETKEATVEEPSREEPIEEEKTEPQEEKPTEETPETEKPAPEEKKE